LPAERNSEQAAPDFDPVALACELVHDGPSVQVVNVADDSMSDAGVLAGDAVLIQPCSNVADGDLAFVESPSARRPQLRRVFVDGPVVRLVPENSSIDPSYFPPGSIRIHGRVVAIVRQRLAA
jgi:SOS-response transcriptional repressor LexA